MSFFSDENKKVWRSVAAFELLALSLLAGCGKADREPEVMIRLADAGLIRSVDTDQDELLFGRPEGRIAEKTGARWDFASKWHTFSVPVELKRAPAYGKLSVSDAQPASDGKGVSIRGLTGIARMVPVKGSTRVLVECKGAFKPAGFLCASVATLSMHPKFPDNNKAGALREFLKSFGQDKVELKRTEEPGVLRLVVTTKPDTRALLLMIYTFEEKEEVLEWARVEELRKAGTPVIDREEDAEKGLHEAIISFPCLGGICRPSLFLPPRTEVKLKEILLPDKAELRCSVGVVGSLDDPIELVVTAEKRNGEVHDIVSMRPGKGSRGWVDLKKDLSHLSRKSVRFSIRGDWVAKDARHSEPPPMLFLGSPLVCARGPAGDSEKKNVVVVSLDTLRFDHLGCYGYERPVSPNLDIMADQGLLFRRAYSHAPFTLPSHASLFTSLYPSVHCADDPKSTVLPEGVPLLAEILARSGMATASFNGGCLVSHEFGFHRGFDLYCEVDPLGDRFLDGITPNMNRLADGSKGSLDRAFSWMEETRDRPFFLFLHTFMVHDYMPPPEMLDKLGVRHPRGLEQGEETWERIKKEYFRGDGLSPEELEWCVDTYDAAVMTADEMVGRLLRELKALDLMNDTLVIVTSDHGEEFMDHGGLLHCWTVYEELIRVPLLMHVPGIKGGSEVETRVNQVDIVPTVLDWLGMDPGGFRFQGRSMLPAFRGERIQERPVYSEVNMPGCTERTCLIWNGWKYIKGNADRSFRFPAPAPVELFRLSDDEKERSNLFDSAPGELKRIEMLMDRIEADFLDARKSLGITKEPAGTISKELKSLLKQQGYL